MIRNRRAKADAQVLRGHIAAILSSHSQLDAPISDKQLAQLIGPGAKLRTVKRHRQWVRRAHAAGELPALVQWLRRARRGEPTD